ncbi:MAG TPA: Ppx/GppA phosphatase family protein [Myxococcaceae bacterium]|nr:Ppx/GppA phosphatase family protein [Myxococcaceae bacterium]HZA51460.1 Ppx/GppA phosphatase family protein [Myxococcaceae bacterium]
MARPANLVDPIIAAIDVGTNAVRLEIARVHADASLETLHQERSQIRPGEGTFASGAMPRAVADRLLSTLRRYGALCRRYRARVRAVATSAVREAKNRPEIVRRVREEAGLELEVVSGREEARLICVGVLHDRPASARSLVIDVGGGSTEIATAVGDRPTNLWSVALGAVRVSEEFASDSKVGRKKLSLMREFAAEIVARGVPDAGVRRFRSAFGSSGTINALIAFAADEDSYPRVRTKRLSQAVDELAAMTPQERVEHFEPHRAEIIVAGAVVLEQVVEHLGLESVIGVDRGLRHGILFELVRKTRTREDDHSIAVAAEALAERFLADMGHSRQVARLAVSLFDDLAPLHRLPASCRPLLEAAAILHDLGHAVSYQRHHRHSYYLIRNADLPGLADQQRELVALIARYHRRSPPEHGHLDIDLLDPGEFRIVRKLATLLRIADSLDRSHHQTVKELRGRVRDGSVVLNLRVRGPVDLELWDAHHESVLFRRVFGKRLDFVTRRG